MNKRLWLDYTKLRSELSFAAVLSHYQFALDTSRPQVKLPCPFHEDDTPSLSANVPEGKFHCFGCGAKGNTLEFIVMMEGGDPGKKEDLRRGAEIALGVLGRDAADFARTRNTPAKRAKLTTDTPKAKKRPEAQVDEKNSATVNSEPVAPQSEPNTNPVLDLELNLDPNHPFLKARGFSEATCRTFGLGYCDRGIMKHRIAIPIHNERGELVAYAGRYADETVPKGTERYRLPQRFHKSLVLFNLHRARTFEKRHVVIVEGYWSAIRLHEAGIPAVALMGTTVSPHQAHLLRDTGFRFATLMLDGDDAGRSAAKDALGTLAKEVYIRTIELPEGEKPDTMSEQFLDKLR